MANIASLDSRTLARRLGELAGDERKVQVEFLQHLAEFDRRRAYLELGYGSLWTFCLEALHLREGPAGRRIAAMKVLRRFPRLAGALRDGSLCLTTLALLGPVLTEENADDLLARAAYRTTAEVDHLVASLKPRQAPREGIRQLPAPARAATAAVPEAPAGGSGDSQREARGDEPPTSPEGERATPGDELTSPPEGERDGVRGWETPPRSRTAEMRAVSEGQWSLRVTVGRALKDDLKTLAALLSHKVRKGDLAAVLHEAIRCGIEKHGKRKGAVRPARKAASRPAPGNPTAVSAEARRQVWERDQGRCAWTSPEGKRCNSRWQVEVDHVEAAARGGPATLDNLRLACRDHNFRHAEEIYGHDYMRKYRKGESTHPGGSGLPLPLAREAEAVA